MRAGCPMHLLQHQLRYRPMKPAAAIRIGPRAARTQPGGSRKHVRSPGSDERQEVNRYSDTKLRTWVAISKEDEWRSTRVKSTICLRHRLRLGKSDSDAQRSQLHYHRARRPALWPAQPFAQPRAGGNREDHAAAGV